jgi:hypothetical protein
MANDTERMQILEMIESGKITPAEGLVLLNALNSAEPALPDEISESEETSETEGTSGEGAQAYPILDRPETLEEAVMPPAFHTPLDAPLIQEAAPQAGAFEQELPPVGEAGIPSPRGEVLSPPSIGPDFSRWRSFWEIPLWIGVGITVLSGILMFLAWQGSGFGFWFACTWLPFLLGVAVIALAWGTRNLPWLHIRVQQKPGERPQHINISLPLPLGVIGWALRTFKHKIPDTGKVNLDEMVMALKHVTPEAPFSVDVEEGANGERVQIYIG